MTLPQVTGFEVDEDVGGNRCEPSSVLAAHSLGLTSLMTGQIMGSPRALARGSGARYLSCRRP